QGLLTKQDEVRVTLVLDSADPGVVDGTALAIARLGGRVTATMGNQIEFVVPVQALVEYGTRTNKRTFFADLADFQHVRDIERTPTAIAHAAGSGTPSARGGKSEGVALTGAEKWQAAGITGKGVKVGVIDGAFNSYQQFLASATVTTKSFRTDGQIEDPTDTESIHGTACAEIVTEMAPDAAIYLAAIETPGEFVAAIHWLVGTVGVSVISTSLGFDGHFPLDGSSPMAQEIDKAKVAGVFFAISAGNGASGAFGTDAAEGHFGATFADSDSDGFHDFSGAKQQNALQVKIDSKPFRITLNWDDWQRPHVNYDLFLYDTKGNEIGRSDNNQTRTGKPPVEVIRGKVARGTYLLKVKKVNASDPDLPFNIFFDGAQFEQTTAANSLSTPTDAEGAFTVAAVDVKTSKVEAYSSEGATMDGRMKPEISGPDNNANFAYASTGNPTFPGTSAATPHVAGAAALYKQAVPDDDFTSPASGLPAPGYQNGAYHIHAEAGDLTPVTYPRFVQSAASETYDMQVRTVGGASDALMGAQVRRLDQDNYVLFVIANDGLYGAFVRVNGSLRSVGTAGLSPAIKANAVNALHVTVTGTTFAFSVNGQLLTQVEIGDSQAQGAFGFVAGGGVNAPADVTLANYRVALR
ncbi:MAG: S8 family serine peptidase, partial [Thermomicrobia bacterium]|nr:S8 family serine peptidase [Thermomicrobia bacterium]